MDDFTLIIGNKNYSSWSFRPWLFLKYHEIPFAEIRIPLYTDTSQEEVRKYSPSGLVPALRDGTTAVWDSLAICEYVTDKYLLQGWPQDTAARATARSVAAEMHSGFMALRSAFPMNLRKRFPWKEPDDAVTKDIARVCSIWDECREKYGQTGPWLFGRFSIADAMFAPVVFRLNGYSVPVSTAAREYMDTVLALAATKEWVAAALQETEVLEAFEVV